MTTRQDDYYKRASAWLLGVLTVLLVAGGGWVVHSLEKLGDTQVKILEKVSDTQTGVAVLEAQMIHQKESADEIRRRLALLEGGELAYVP